MLTMCTCSLKSFDTDVYLPSSLVLLFSVRFLHWLHNLLTKNLCCSRDLATLNQRHQKAAMGISDRIFRTICCCHKLSCIMSSSNSMKLEKTSLLKREQYQFIKSLRLIFFKPISRLNFKDRVDQ